ncbi:MAG: zinc-ribbon domain-containing protein, partial [Clostridia bacterium]|nr:zinc-ribbon domain-containing protein [Clostridia bacterium]
AVKGKNDLATLNPKLASEWNYKRNGDSKPEDFAAGSHKKVWWKCENGHEWQATIANRVKGRGCPYCAGKKVLPGFNDLSTTNPTLSHEWHPTKNEDLLPTMVTLGSRKKVWWICKNGHEWETEIVNRTTAKTGCPYCSGKKVLSGFNDLLTSNPKLASEWHPTKNGDLLATMVSSGSHKKVWWICKNGHEWQSEIANRNAGNGCPICRKTKNKEV